MLKHFCLENSCFIIKSEDDLIDVFDALLSQGVEPYEAYKLIVEKYGKEVISKVLEDKNSKE